MLLLTIVCPQSFSLLIFLSCIPLTFVISIIMHAIHRLFTNNGISFIIVILSVTLSDSLLLSKLILLEFGSNCSLNQLGGIVHILTLTLFDSTTVPLFPIPSGPYFTLYPTSIPWSFLAIILPPSPYLYFLFILLIWKILTVHKFNPVSTQLNVVGEKTLPYYPISFSIHDCHPKMGSQRCQAIPPPVPDSVVLLNGYLLPFLLKSLKPLSISLPSVDYFLHP